MSKINIDSNNSKKNNNILENEKSPIKLNGESNENIDIIELIYKIWDKKILIFTITLIFLLLSFFHANHREKYYLAKVLLLPPSNIIKTQEKINGDNFELFYSNKDFYEIYSEYKKNLASRKMQKKFILEKNLIKELSPDSSGKIDQIAVFEIFASMLKIEEIKNLSFSVVAKDPVFAAVIANNYVKFVNQETVNLQLEVANNNISEKIKDIEYKISSKRDMAKLRRMDQISRFEEARIIAESLGFIKRVDATNIIQSNSSLHTEIASATTPLYYIGTKALSAEISILRNRISDDPFIRGLRDLQEQLAFLKRIDLKKLNLSAVTIDQEAYPQTMPIGMPTRTIVFFGSLVGFSLGLFLSILTIFFQIKHKIYLDRKK